MLLSFLFCVSALRAEEIEINVHTAEEPKAALGIFFASGKVVQQPNTSFERISPEIVVVRMPYEFSKLPSATPFATAYVLTDSDEVVFGDVRLVSAADPVDSFFRIPVCAADKTRTKAEIPLPEQLNYLESLLQVRIKKREVAQQVLRDTMTPDLLTRLQKLEKGFGLEASVPLSADLSGLELVERLSRLIDAIKVYRQSNRTPVPSPEPQ